MVTSSYSLFYQNYFVMDLLTFVEYVYNVIYENYECILPSQDGKMIKQIDKWNTPSLYLDFIMIILLSE